MIKLNNIDIEYPTIAPNPEFGYEQEYREHIMISGKRRRDIRGQRFKAKIIYSYLTDAQINVLYSIIATQETNGYVSAEISMPGGTTFTGEVHVSMSEAQVRFCIVNGVSKWFNWSIELSGVDLV